MCINIKSRIVFKVKNCFLCRFVIFILKMSKSKGTKNSVLCKPIWIIVCVVIGLIICCSIFMLHTFNKDLKIADDHVEKHKGGYHGRHYHYGGNYGHKYHKDKGRYKPDEDDDEYVDKEQDEKDDDYFDENDVVDEWPQVIIGGGGYAGIAFAERLAARGIAYKIFEARDRLGGRMKSVDFGNDPETDEPYFVAAGANWVSCFLKIFVELSSIQCYF